MCNPRQMDRQFPAMGGCCRGCRNDSFSAGNSSVSRRRVSSDWEMKKNLVIVLVVALAAVLAARYLQRPGGAPRGQEPVVSLSNQHFNEFEKAFDEGADVPRLVLLLSPT